MIIKKLTLNNIRSYINETIEFPKGILLLAGDIGSGKSTLLMALDFALFGFRRGELSGSDLLRHGADSGSVELEMELGGRYVKISRQLKRGNTITQNKCSLIINDVVTELTPSELTARILELLGYPETFVRKKAMLFRYSVYTPQEQMKQIVSAEPDKRLNTIRKIFNIEKYGKIRANTGIVLTELRTMQRLCRKEVEDIDEKQKELLQYENELAEIKNKFASANEKKLEQVKIVENIQNQRKTVEEEILKQNELKRSITESKVKLESISSMNEKMIKEKDELKNKEIVVGEKPVLIDEELVKKTIQEKERKRNMFADERAVLVKEIDKFRKILTAGLCDTCEQKVYEPERFRMKIDEKQGKMNELVSEISKIEHELANAKQELEENNRNKIKLEKYENAVKQKQEIEKKMGDIEKQINENIQILDKLKNEIEEKEKQLNPELDKKKNETDALYEEANSKLIVLEKECSGLEQEKKSKDFLVNKLKQEIDKKQKAQEREKKLGELIAMLDPCFMELMTTMENHVMRTLQVEFDSYFRNYFELMVEELNVGINEDFSVRIEQNGYETEFTNLSGGEKTGVALAYRLAMNKIINNLSETINTKNLLILDEPTDGFSNEQLDKLRDVLYNLNLEQIIIVSHEPKLESFVDNVIRLSKEEHVSKII
jgi:exonuclease SbcC